jgi:hypothetical protein
MSDDVLIPPASVAQTGFISRTGGHHGHHGHHDHDWPERTSERVRGHLSDLERDQAEQTRDVMTAIEKNGASVELAVEKIGAASILATSIGTAATALAIEKTAAAAMLSAEKIGAASQLGVLVAASQAQLLATQNASAAALTAAQNHAAALAQAAACCCELKELIRAENGQTRDLINANTVQGLRDALAAAQRFIPLTVTVPL